MTNHDSGVGIFGVISSILSTLVAFAAAIQPLVSLVAGLVAIASGIFAIRYYYKKTHSK